MAAMPIPPPHILRAVATALDAGLGLGTFVETPRLASTVPPLLLTTLREAVRSGRPLGDALRQAEFLDDGGAAIVNAGVDGGFLPGALRATADLLDERLRRRRRMLLAVAYPAGVLLAACVLLPLPAIVEGGIAAWARLALPGIGAIVATLMLVFVVVPGSSVATRQRLTGLLARLPVVGGIIVDDARATGLDVLQRLLSAGVPATRALPRALLAAGLPSLSQMAPAALAVIDDGGTLSDALGTAGLADDATVGRLAVAEHTGCLDQTLPGLVAELQDRARRRFFALVMGIGVVVGVAGAVVVGWQIVRGFQAYLETIDAVGRE